MTGKYGKDPAPEPNLDLEKHQDTKDTQHTQDTQLDPFGESPLFDGSPIKISSDEEIPYFPDRLSEDEMGSPVGGTSVWHDFTAWKIAPPKFDTTPESKKVPTGDLCKAMLARKSPFKNEGEDQDAVGSFDDEDTLKLGDTPPPTPRKRPRGPADFGAECSMDRQFQFRRLNATDFS